eukprot:CAMPEP_0202859396 /NCGR_PEP_ID=MMETSP1391-20130828/1529_1 /ASSEMBLY_ACC=CAM_ASM_000867 /TAXON_ID=1034604 /ORGANISM="Chlamydomonas leiostraca, Strain SAG 11-49" /LENGTH=42 /DNA_ID= /DNA_START= /DNA_END= /DNA_ORIENTATION=
MAAAATPTSCASCTILTPAAFSTAGVCDVRRTGGQADDEPFV